MSKNIKMLSLKDAWKPLLSDWKTLIDRKIKYQTGLSQKFGLSSLSYKFETGEYFVFPVTVIENQNIIIGG